MNLQAGLDIGPGNALEIDLPLAAAVSVSQASAVTQVVLRQRDDLRLESDIGVRPRLVKLLAKTNSLRCNEHA